MIECLNCQAKHESNEIGFIVKCDFCRALLPFEVKEILASIGTTPKAARRKLTRKLISPEFKAPEWEAGNR